MISRLTFPEGENLPKELDEIRQALARLLGAHVTELEFLEPGVYDVTPAIWTRNTHRHELTVLDSGDGLYRMLPKDDTVGILLPSSGGAQSRRGGIVNHISAENPLAIISGGHPRKDWLQIFGIVLHTSIFGIGEPRK